MCFKGKIGDTKTKTYCFIRVVFIPEKLGVIFNKGGIMKFAEIADKLWDIALVVLLIAFMANLIYGGILHAIG